VVLVVLAVVGTLWVAVVFVVLVAL
jgi:hypothetical protein